MGEFSDINGGTSPVKPPQRKGITISHAAAFILLLLAICLSVLVGLVVHFASPKSSTVTPTVVVPPMRPAELKGECLQMIHRGDTDVCSACPTQKPATTMKPATSSSPHKISTTKAATTKPSITATSTYSSPSTTMAGVNRTSVMTSTPPGPTSSTTSLASSTPAPVINYRLPASVKPFHYEVKLQPEIYGQNSSLFTFNGSVSIIMNVTEPTSTITLHKKDMDIHEDISLEAIDNLSVRAPSIVNTSYDEVRHFFLLHLEADLDPQRSYKLSMTFEAKMRTDGSGLYLSWYKDDNNQTVYLVSTQFEAPDARKAFPCFDEPAMKATFDITLIRKTGTGRNYRTLANTDTIRQEPWGTDYIADVYATTPRMPTYLLAFAVCDFEQYENMTSGITYRTIGRPNGLKYLDKAHDYGLKLFDWYEATFDPPYPIDKLDNLAVPNFKSGAMENWGLIIYREDIMFIPGVTTASYNDWTYDVVSHEIAHQWFGNIVSPKWWWWLWLNEGFATFFEYRAVDIEYPQNRAGEQFMVQSAHWTMVVDSSPTSHPMTNDVESHDEVEGSFDSITYTKAGCIIRMMDFIMGKENFIKGLNLYLTRHQYDVAEHQDLWDALTESTQDGTPINMTEIMDPWVTQMNFPLVTVRVLGAWVIHVKQERFLNNMSMDTSGDKAKYDYRWTIPITIATSKNYSNFDKEYTYNDIAWLKHTRTDTTVVDPIIPDPVDEESWVVVNFHQIGFYRVNYEESNWRALIKQLEKDHTVFPPLTRAQIINDAWTLQKQDIVKMEIALRTLNYMKAETDYVPWRAFYREIGTLENNLQNTELDGAFRAYMKSSSELTFNTWGFDITDETPNINIYQINRGAIYACKYGVTQCQTQALQLFRNWMANEENNRLNQNIQRAIMCNAVRYGGMAEWNFAFDRYKQKDSHRPQISVDAFVALTCTMKSWLLERMLQLSTDNNTFSFGDARYVIQNVNNNPNGRALAWNFVKSNFMALENYLGEKIMSQMIPAMAFEYNTEHYISELQDMKSRQNESYATAFDLAVKRVRNNIDWMNDNKAIVSDWLKELGYSDYLP